MNKKYIPILLLSTILVGCNNTNNIENEDNKKQSQVETVEQKKDIEEVYESSTNEKSQITLNGKTSELPKNKEELINNFGVKEVSENVFKTDDNKEFSIVEDDEYLSFHNLNNIDITLPYDISTTDDIEKAKEKLKDTINLTLTENPDENIRFLAEDTIYNLIYDDGKLIYISFEKNNEEATKYSMDIKNETEELEDDNSGIITLNNNEFNFPVLYKDLNENILNGKIEKTNKENMEYFIYEPEEIDYNDNKRVIISTKDYKYLVDYSFDLEEIDETENNPNYVTQLTFKTDVPFEFKNDKITVNNKNYNELKSQLEEKDMIYNDNLGDIVFYLDDNTKIFIDEDVVTLVKSDKHTRKTDEAEMNINQNK